ncbi:MAG: nuclear transport factor 2 family protein [Armatimonadota bacterium]|nr:nuclear transport factor 2 family protein [Armatimonadota bacterium]
MSTTVLELAEQALVALDSIGLASLYADDFAFEDTSAGVRITTKDALIDYFDQLFAWPDVKFSNVSFFTAGDRGAGQWTWEGKSTQSGTPFTIRGASLFKLKGSTIAEEIIFYDPRPAYA